MSISYRKKNKAPFWLALLLSLGLGWSLYRFVKAEAVSLDVLPPPRPVIVPRADWGARPLDWNAPEETGPFDAVSNPAGVLVYPSELRGVLTGIVIHHSAFGHSGPAAIQALHMDRRGFADAAYHFIIDLDGAIYEGREMHVRGAHVQGYNTGSLGLVLIGNFNEEEPSPAQLDSLTGLVDYLRYTYGIRYLAGHKDYPDQSPDGTLCPGEHLYALLPGLAQELGMEYGIGGMSSQGGSSEQLTGLTQNKKCGAKIGVACAAHGPYFRFLFAYCVSPIIIITIPRKSHF